MSQRNHDDLHSKFVAAYGGCCAILPGVTRIAHRVRVVNCSRFLVRNRRSSRGGVQPDIGVPPFPHRCSLFQHRCQGVLHIWTVKNCWDPFIGKLLFESRRQKRCLTSFRDFNIQKVGLCKQMVAQVASEVDRPLGSNKGSSAHSIQVRCSSPSTSFSLLSTQCFTQRPARVSAQRVVPEFCLPQILACWLTSPRPLPRSLAACRTQCPLPLIPLDCGTEHLHGRLSSCIATRHERSFTVNSEIVQCQAVDSRNNECEYAARRKQAYVGCCGSLDCRGRTHDSGPDTGTSGFRAFWEIVFVWIVEP